MPPSLPVPRTANLFSVSFCAIVQALLTTQAGTSTPFPMGLRVEWSAMNVFHRSPASSHAHFVWFSRRQSDSHADFRRFLSAFFTKPANGRIGSNLVRHLRGARARLSRCGTPLAHRTPGDSETRQLIQPTQRRSTEQA